MAGKGQDLRTRIDPVECPNRGSTINVVAFIGRHPH
jgi:hypothetical protein